MKNNYFYVILFCLLSFGVRSQTSIAVTADPPLPICTPGSQSDLTCSFVQTYQTVGYNVASIPFNPPYGYTNGSATSLTIDDRWTGIIDLKGFTPEDFNFCFYNNSYSQCLVSTNGAITFSIAGVVAGGLYTPGSGSTWVNSGLIPFSGPSAQAPFKNSINGVFQDTNPAVDNAFANPNINYYTTGTYPNRVFVVNIAEVAQFGCSSDPTVGAQTSQMILYEGTNIIDVYVARRYPCVSWSSGNGLIGVQNNAGTIGTTPAGRNGGAWITNNEAWRFTPNGAPITPTFEWRDENNVLVGSSQNISVNPTQTTTYTVTAFYPTCDPAIRHQVSDQATVEIVDIPVATPLSYNVCDTGQTTFEFDFSGNTNHILNGADPVRYFLAYHTTESSAQGTYADMITGDISAYQTTAASTTIWVSVEDLLYGCIETLSFSLNAQNCQVDDMSLCDIGNDGSESFNLSLQNTPILDGDNAADYNITYHTTLSSADGTTLNSDLIPAGAAVGQQDNFVSSGQTIYFRKAHVTDPTNVFVESFDLIVLPLPVITGNATICENFTTQLSSTAAPSATTPWASDNTAVATVSATGLVSGVSNGTANITYTDVNGCQNTVLVTVNDTPTITGTLTVCQGATTQLTGSGTSSGTTPWTSATPAVATVTNTGLITAVAAGTSVITYTDANGCQTTATVTVTTLPTIGGTLSACVSGTSQLTATNAPAAVNPWVSSNTTVANIDTNGLVTASSAGTTTITFTDLNGCQATATFTVNELPSVTVSSSVVCAGQSTTVTATPAPAGTYVYTWTVPSGATNPGNVATFSTTTAGTYSVVITNPTTNCSSTSASGTVTHNPIPVVTVANVAACTGDSATITASPATAGSYNYVWTVPSGVTNPGNVQSFSTSVTGTYSVVITDTTTGCSSASASGVFSTSPAGGSLNLQCGAYNSATGELYVDWSNVPGITTFNYSYSIAGGPVVTGSQNSPSSIYIVTNGLPITFTLSGTGTVCVPTQTITCGCPNPVINNNTNQNYCSGQNVPQYNFTTTDAYDSVSWTNSNPAIGLPASGNTFFLPTFTAATVATPQTATITVVLTRFGCVGSTRTFTITINPPVTPTFTQVNPICSGAVLAALPTTSTNGVSGTWSPALNNTATTTYTFTPSGGQCATTAQMTITVNPNVVPTFTQVAPICSGGTLAALPTTSNNGITGTWSPAMNNTATTTYTFTPTAGLCATTAQMTITVTPNTVPTFTQVAPICSGGSLSALPTTSNNGVTGTWSPALNNTATTTYTFTPTAGLCATTAQMTIVVNSVITPTFTQVAPICSGSALAALPTTSTNGITGTWSPAMNNTATTTYTFTPSAGQCATTAQMTITVNPIVTPAFTQVAPICSGGTLAALPTTSNNGITGTWSPAMNNTATTTYTFTPTAGLCATTAQMTITVTPNTVPTFTQVAPICSGGSLSALPTTSNNGVTGTWSPALNNTATTTYTFTPTAGLCATTAQMTIVVNPVITPTFTQVAPICSGSALAALPTTSTNGITGTWSPALDNTATTTYTFTPTAGQCASTAQMTIVVNPVVTPTFNFPTAYCSGVSPSPLPTTSLEGITGTWSPAFNNAATTTYTFTPSAGQCAVTPPSVTIQITQAPIATVTVTTTVCDGATLDFVLGSNIASTTFSWSASSSNINPSMPLSGDETNIDQVLQLIDPMVSGSVTFNIIPSANGCNGQMVSRTIIVNPIPVINTHAVSDTTICSGDSVAIDVNGTPTGTVYNWVVINAVNAQVAGGVTSGSSSTGDINVVIQATNQSVAGTIQFEITPVRNGCTGTAVQTDVITVYPAPGTPIPTPVFDICSEESPDINVNVGPTSISGAEIEWTVVNVQNVTGASDGTGTLPFVISQVLTNNTTQVGYVTYRVRSVINGCYGGTTDYIVRVNPAPLVTLTGGTICVDALGNAFTSVLLDTGLSASNYLFDWTLNGNPIVGGSSILVDETSEIGEYNVIVTNITTGCSSLPAIATVVGHNVGQDLVLTTSQSFEQNGTITVTVVGGSGNYLYSLDGGPWQESNVFTYVVPGEHEVEVTDIHSCTQLSGKVYLINYPYFFTPNGDGIWDTWNIWDLRNQPNAEIHIFDRYGKLIKQLTPSGDGWNGTLNGQLLPSADYWFTVKFIDPTTQTERVFKSHFSMKR